MPKILQEVIFQSLEANHVNLLFFILDFFKTLVRQKSFTENTEDNMWSLSQNLLFSAAVLGKLFDPLLFDHVRHNCLWKTKEVKCKMPQAEIEQGLPFLEKQMNCYSA